MEVCRGRGLGTRLRALPCRYLPLPHLYGLSAGSAAKELVTCLQMRVCSHDSGDGGVFLARWICGCSGRMGRESMEMKGRRRRKLRG